VYRENFTFILKKIKHVIPYCSINSGLNIENLIKYNEIKASHYHQNAASNEDVIPNQSTLIGYIAVLFWD